MSSRFEVVWAEAAARDLEELVDYIARDSEGDAEKILNRLRARAESLGMAPSRGRFVPELRPYGIRTWHELMIRPYRIDHAPRLVRLLPRPLLRSCEFEPIGTG